MRKDKHFNGEPVFAQIIKLLPLDDIRLIAQKSSSDRYVKKFCTVQHLIAMLYGVTSSYNSLREVVSGIVSYGDNMKKKIWKISGAQNRLARRQLRMDWYW
jgi:hypothetical protein